MAAQGHKPVRVSGKRLTLYEQLERGGMSSLGSMEGGWGGWDVVDPVAGDRKKGEVFRGVGLAVVLTLVAWWVHRLPFAPFTLDGAALKNPLGFSVMAILLGMVMANVARVEWSRVGCRWIAAWCLPVAVVLMGAGLEVSLLAGMGWKLLVMILGVMALAVAGAMVLGRFFGLSGRAAFLLGTGTAVCGSSAILAVAPVVKAEDEEVVATVGVVNLIGLIAMFACVGLLWVVPVEAMEAGDFGAWAGMTIHAVPQVVAAGESHSEAAAAMATLVKLTRVALLAPLVVICAVVLARKGAGGGAKRKFWQYVPWFVWGFVGLVVVRAMGWLPVLEYQSGKLAGVRVESAEVLTTGSKWLLALSMAAIGLQVNLKSIMKTGAKAMAAGLVVWGVMAVVAYFLVRAS